MNIGVYFEQGTLISNRRFKEYDCQIRKRIDDQGASGSEWWRIERGTDMDALLQDIKIALKSAEQWFARFPSKETVIRKLLDGTAEQYSNSYTMNFQTAKLLVEMGYAAEVYVSIKNTRWTHPRATTLIALAEEIEKKMFGLPQK